MDVAPGYKRAVEAVGGVDAADGSTPGVRKGHHGVDVADGFKRDVHEKKAHHGIDVADGFERDVHKEKGHHGVDVADGF